MSDPMMHLAVLPTAAPDAARAERLRARCRAQLERRAQRPRPPRPPGARLATRIWQPLAVLIGIGYLAEVVVLAVRVYGLR
ncbi:MAG: hypothetical protein AB7U83_02135 [Vicinamibacterales bacterium]